MPPSPPPARPARARLPRRVLGAPLRALEAVVLLVGSVLLGSLLLGACAGERPAGRGSGGHSAATRLAVLGLDGFEWSVALPLLVEGRLPHLESLMRRGVWGELQTLVPTQSPVIWTTIATGKPHQKHGIHSFARLGAEGELRLFNSTDRRTKAIWNVLSDAGLDSWVVGWWMTFPVEEIRGVMVAQTNTLEAFESGGAERAWKGTLLEGVAGQVHPAARQEEMLAILRRVESELPRLEAAIFTPEPGAASRLAVRLWESCRWALRADATYLRIAERLAAGGELPDLTLLYLGTPDVVGHRFWRYREPERFEHPPTGEEVTALGGVLDAAYVWVDEALGRLLELYGEETTWFLVSDHGMGPYNRSRGFTPDEPVEDLVSGHHKNAPPGIFVAAGPAIRRGGIGPRGAQEGRGLGMVGTVLDLTPTLLALLGVPAGEDMDGRVMSRLLDPEAVRFLPKSRIATHDTPDFLAARGAAAPERAEAERLEQLRALGYLDD